MLLSLTKCYHELMGMKMGCLQMPLIGVVCFANDTNVRKDSPFSQEKGMEPKLELPQ